jgi:S-adenosylmethionine hydrolase
MRRLVTLLTDFGTEDTYVGQAKGSILSVAPEARIVDLPAAHLGHHGVGAPGARRNPDTGA